MHFKNLTKYLLPFLLITTLFVGCGSGAFQDSDHDGFSDQEEIDAGTDPQDPVSRPPSKPTKPTTPAVFAFTSSTAVSSNECEVLPGHTLTTANATGAVTYAITGGTDAVRFMVDAATGVVSAADTNKTDFESKPTYTYTVSATSGGKTATQTVTVSLNQVLLTTGAFSYGCVPNNTTGKVWLDKNLGATIVCPTSNELTCVGGFYQFGRGTDGHEVRNSPKHNAKVLGGPGGGAPAKRARGRAFTINAINSVNGVSINGAVIVDAFTWWTVEDNDGMIRAARWADSTGGVGSICPVGYRVPTITELNAEAASWVTSDAAGAFASPLKLGVTGYRRQNATAKYIFLTRGYYRATTGVSHSHDALRFTAGAVASTSLSDTQSANIRCIKN